MKYIINTQNVLDSRETWYFFYTIVYIIYYWKDKLELIVLLRWRNEEEEEEEGGWVEKEGIDLMHVSGRKRGFFFPWLKAASNLAPWAKTSDRL